MSDFESSLEAKLARNDELAEERRDAEAEMDRIEQERAEQAEQRQQELHQQRLARHAELVDHLQKVAGKLRDATGDDFMIRMGWTESGEEFIAKASTRGLIPARSLLIELDRDDDEVLARWNTDVGNTLELWRLLEVGPPLLETLLLQITDQDYWNTATSPPDFPE
jgi:uncharacterized protein YdcH (DUF465 family)